MRWSLQLLPYQLWRNTKRGSKFFVTKAEYRVSALDGRDGYGSDAEYRCPVVPGRTFRFPHDFVHHYEAPKDEAMAKFVMTLSSFGNLRTTVMRAWDGSEHLRS